MEGEEQTTSLLRKNETSMFKYLRTLLIDYP